MLSQALLLYSDLLELSWLPIALQHRPPRASDAEHGSTFCFSLVKTTWMLFLASAYLVLPASAVLSAFFFFPD